MFPRHERPHGFTIVEAAVVIAISIVLTTLAYPYLTRLVPRASFMDTAAELEALLHGARQTALANGHDVYVLVFPKCATPSGTGRVVVYEDGNFDFSSDAATKNFAGYDCMALGSGSRSSVLGTLDLPLGVSVGPSTGRGASAKLVAPYTAVDVQKDCPFCATAGDRRGAIRFDPRGRAWFYSGNGSALYLPAGSSLSLASSKASGVHTIVIISGTGSVTGMNQG